MKSATPNYSAAESRSRFGWPDAMALSGLFAFAPRALDFEGLGVREPLGQLRPTCRMKIGEKMASKRLPAGHPSRHPDDRLSERPDRCHATKPNFHLTHVSLSLFRQTQSLHPPKRG
jgi:hypothetical protein